MKKIYLIPILTFILTLVLSCDVFASSTTNEADATGYNSWSQSEKEAFHDYVTRNNPLIGVYGWDCLSDELLATNYPQIYTQGYDTYLEFLVAHSTVDEETGTITYDDDALGLLNYVKEEADEKLTYCVAYLPTSSQFSASLYTNRYSYLALTQLMQNNPSYAFKASTSSVSKNMTFEDGTNSTISGLESVVVMPVPFAGVSSTFYTTMAAYKTTFYDDSWSTSMTLPTIYVKDSADSFRIYWKDVNVEYWQYIEQPSDVSKIDLSTLGNTTYNTSVTGYVASAPSVFNGGFSSQTSTFYSDFTGSIYVYESVAAMKAGTAGGGTAQIMPGYTPGAITDNSITTSEVNEYVTTYNNYYGSSGGSDSGSGGSGSGGSGGSGFSGFLDALGSLGDVILGIVGKLVEIVADIIEVLSDAIMMIIDVIPENVGQFFEAVFSWMPKEWITIITLALTLTLIIVLIKLVRG